MGSQNNYFFPMIIYKKANAGLPFFCTFGLNISWHAKDYKDQFGIRNT